MAAPFSSRPSRARGLKQSHYANLLNMHESRPSRARGLKRSWKVDCLIIGSSRPSRARGLKQKGAEERGITRLSRPSRARGLKRVLKLDTPEVGKVAPFTGAWIETSRHKSQWRGLW